MCLHPLHISLPTRLICSSNLNETNKCARKEEMFTASEENQSCDDERESE